MWQRHVLETGYPTNFIPNIIAPNSKHFTNYQLNNGLPSAGQIMWLHHFKSLVQVFFSTLKNSFNIGTYQRTNMLILIYLQISANNIGKPIYFGPYFTYWICQQGGQTLTLPCVIFELELSETNLHGGWGFSRQTVIAAISWLLTALFSFGRLSILDEIDIDMLI